MTLWLPIGLLLLGLGLIMTEMLLPSLGLLSVLAGASLIGSIATAFAIDVETGIQFVVATTVLVPFAIVGGMKLLPKSPLGRKMIASGLSFEARRATDERDLSLVGREGVVEAPLRPAGTARIDGRRVDVVSRGELIETGVRVRVLDVRGNRVVVTRHGTDAEDARAAGGARVEPNVSTSEPTEDR